ncbi:hypothetical protein TGRH88_056080 [Toxoplasma gondii]|uniref:SWIM-type domain-containing protein n=1 Tax=Toxoplasma gondii TaxID=5811 RepID=A0A7J6JZW9_TOXGO|nr:hypothetical protein TGRH88_056080 [Toxoplasma gondii]
MCCTSGFSGNWTVLALEDGLERKPSLFNDAVRCKRLVPYGRRRGFHKCRSGPETVLEQCTGEAGLTLVEVLRAIKQAKVAGADLGVFFHLLDSLLPPALLQEAVDCMERGAVTAYCCSDSTAAFHVVRPGQEDLSVFAAKGGRTLTGDSEPSSAIGNRDNAGACRSRGYLVLPRHCSCKAFQCNVLAQESDLTCVHEIAVQLAEAMDCVGRRVVLEPEEFSQRLLDASAETVQLQRLHRQPQPSDSV